MESKAQAIGRLETQLLSGWSERIVWTDSNGIKRSEQRKQQSLIEQLQDEISQPRAPIASDGSKNANKSKSSEPGNMRALHIIEDIECHLATARMRMKHALEPELHSSSIAMMARHLEITHDEILSETIADLSKVVKQARVLLSYDVPKSALGDTVCDQCGGTLIVAQDASSDVLCIGIEGVGGCGRKYRRTEWAKMLEETNALVDTLSALIYTGRPIGTLFRWATEGRITRHGGRGHGQARWSLRQLPHAIPGQPLPPPPPLPRRPLPTPLPTAHAPVCARDSTPDKHTQGGRLT